jgi:hypothetical protein
MRDNEERPSRGLDIRTVDKETACDFDDVSGEIRGRIERRFAVLLGLSMDRTSEKAGEFGASDRELCEGLEEKDWGGGSRKSGVLTTKNSKARGNDGGAGVETCQPEGSESEVEHGLPELKRWRSQF